MARGKWSYSALMALRRCNRQYYFSYHAPSHHFTNAFRRRAYELKNAQSLIMWQGSVIDKAMERWIIPALRDKQKLDFDLFSNQAIDLAKAQFKFSEERRYKDKTLSKTKVGDVFCILDIHESGIHHSEQEVLEIYDNIWKIIHGIPEILITRDQIPITEYLKKASFLVSNVTGKYFEFEGIRVSPQIDLLAYIEGKPVVIDWKVSKSAASDYSRQLVIIGITLLDDSRRKSKENGRTSYEVNDITQTRGNAEFKLILEDIFHQTMLAFSAPDRQNSLPITLKIIDTLIRSFAHQTTEMVLEEQEANMEKAILN